MKKVILPNEETVEVPIEIGSDWFEDQKVGFMHPKDLAPYAKQPRIYMDPVKLKELKVSIASKGVRDPIIITPVSKAPWAAFHEGDEKLPFMIVSGHRRHKMALSANLEAVPVVVRVYCDEESFDSDAELLNDHRQDLSEIEIGWRLRRRRNKKFRTADLIRDSGRSRKWVVNRMFLTYLCPTIQKLVSPELRPRERLAIGFAAALGTIGLGRNYMFDKDFNFEAKLVELGDKVPLLQNLSDEEKRFRVQKAYFEYCSKKGWKGSVSEKFVYTGESPIIVTDQSNGASEKALVASEKPKGLRMRMLDWFLELNEMSFLDMTKHDLSLAFSNAVKQDLVGMAARLDMTADVIRQIALGKKEFSQEALGGQKRPEQKIFQDD